MNEDIVCWRIIQEPVLIDCHDNEALLTYACGKPKNPEFLYCDDCMKEIFDENSVS